VHRIEVKRQMAGGDIEAVRGLLQAATHADAHAPLDEHAWLDLVQGGREGFAGLVAWEDDHDHPVGYAQVSRGSGSWALEFVVDPHHRVPGNTIGLDLVEAAAAIIASEGGGHVHMWVNQPRPEHDRIATAIGLTPGRVLYQMRRPLPVEESLRPEGPALTTRPFQVGSDEEAWLEVNNRAFHWHPEQGGWTEETIKAREVQPWFDADGFLLYEPEDDPGRLAGFCWTKVHNPSLGEIYVVAVDPDFTGRGLGRQLTLAGLGYLASKGLSEAMLYVDATNAPAVKLYVELGFTVNHIDRAYTGDIAPAGPPSTA
jgi:mycothiol synthase